MMILVGLHRNDSDEDWMDLYGVNLDGGIAFIPLPTGFEAYAVPFGSGDHETGWIPTNHFPA